MSPATGRDGTKGRSEEAKSNKKSIPQVQLVAVPRAPASLALFWPHKQTPTKLPNPLLHTKPAHNGPEDNAARLPGWGLHFNAA